MLETGTCPGARHRLCRDCYRNRRGMARRKDQAARRLQLVSATIELIADHGIEELTLAAIAERVGVSHRLRALDETADPARRLAQLIRSGLPRQQDRRLSQVLNELSVSASRSQAHARLMTQLFDREVSLYLSVLQDGQAGGAFRLSQPALTVARNLVALEDAYGFHMLAKSSSVDAAAALDARSEERR